MAESNPMAGTSRFAFWSGPLPVMLLTAILLLPFLNKAYHLDDTLFLRLAEQIQEHPLEPYALEYIWFSKPLPFWKVTQNPPVNGYLIAAVTSVGGMREPVLHTVYAGIAVGCSLLMFLLAKRFCRYPNLAVSATIVAPGFLVTAGSVMADIPMLFFWLLAVWAAVRFGETRRPGFLWLAGLCASAAAMNKYFGASLVPLLLIYCFPYAHRRRMHLGALLLPVVTLIAWGAYAYEQSGIFHPLGAISYSMRTKETMGETFWKVCGYSFSFLGGALLWPTMMLPLLALVSRRRVLLGVYAIVLAALIGWAVASESSRNEFSPPILYGLMVLSGGTVAILAARSWIARRDWPSTLLGLWFFGTLAFSLFLNWTINARIIVPCAFPAAVLVARWLETLDKPEFWSKWWAGALLPVGVVALLVAAADYEFAGAGRSFARTTIREKIQAGRRVQFAGHWGFQYYMEEEGARPINYLNPQLKDRDLLVYPFFNSSVIPLETTTNLVYDSAKLDGEKSFPNSFGLHTMEPEAGAGFYSSLWGVVPFAFHHQPYIDRFLIEQYIQQPSRPESGSER